MGVKVILSIAWMYTAIILGAGFASGREILTFFIKYGDKGFYGLCVSTFIFGVVGLMTLRICQHKNIYTAIDFYKTLLPDFYFLFEIIINIFLFVSYITMLSATGSTFNQQFNFPNIVGIIIMSMICYVAYKFGTGFISKLNLFVAPLLFCGCILSSIYIIFNSQVNVSVFSHKINWLKSAVLYSSYNLITPICVIISMRKTIKNKKNTNLGVLLGAILIGILGFIIGLAVYFNYDIASANQIPMLAIINNYSKQLSHIYLITFFLAVLTTALGNFFSLCQTLQHRIFILDSVVFISLLGILLANVKFESLVEVIYPLFGYVGLFQIILISISCFF